MKTDNFPVSRLAENGVRNIECLAWGPLQSAMVGGPSDRVPTIPYDKLDLQGQQEADMKRKLLLEIADELEADGSGIFAVEFLRRKAGEYRESKRVALGKFIRVKILGGQDVENILQGLATAFKPSEILEALWPESGPWGGATLKDDQ
jgi:hypothetical protein